jgi:hypothetical protein
VNMDNREDGAAEQKSRPVGRKRPKLADQLRAIRVFNNHGLLSVFGASGDVAIEYSSGGVWSVRGTTVWSPHPSSELSKPTIRESGWHTRFIGKRAETFQLAINWAMERFDHDYVVSPFGGRIPQHVLHKARRAIRKATES